MKISMGIAKQIFSGNKKIIKKVKKSFSVKTLFLLQFFIFFYQCSHYYYLLLFNSKKNHFLPPPPPYSRCHHRAGDAGRGRRRGRPGRSGLQTPRGSRPLLQGFGRRPARRQLPRSWHRG